METTEEGKPAPFDAEWECRKLSGRIMDIMDIIDDLKSKDKSLSARISRLRLQKIEEAEEEGEGIGEGEREDVRREVEDMSLEERAILFAKLSGRERPSL